MGKTTAILVLVAALLLAYSMRDCCFGDAPLPAIRDEYYGAGAEKKDDPKVEKFKVDVPEPVLEDLRQRLERTRFTEPLEDVKFRYGANGDFMKKIQAYWRDSYDWRKAEAEINSFPQFKTEIEGLKIHFMRVKPPANKYKKVIPLLLVHGWPGSVYEFHKVLAMLTDPRGKLGAETETAFEVVAPSIPGYGWSDAPRKPGFGPVAAARIFGKLMDRLEMGSDFVCQGGDWGSIICTILAQMRPTKMLGLHINMAAVMPNAFPAVMLKMAVGTVAPSLVLHPNDYHKVYPLAELFGMMAQESGYMHIQATKPDTVGFGLNDSPMGLAAYILEKFSTWTHPAYRDLPDGGLARHFTLDELLTNVMVYWTTGSIASSQRFYKECFAHPDYNTYERAAVRVPTGVAAFPNELLVSPRNFLAHKFLNLTTYTDMPRGGHFAAFEEPKLLAEDVFRFVLGLSG